MESDRKKVIIWGGELKKKIQFDVAEKQVIYRDRDHNENFFSINDDILSRHIVMIGGSGSGKTNVFNLTLDQLRRKKNENDIFIIFDTKGDFLRRFGRGEIWSLEMDGIIGKSVPGGTCLTIFWLMVTVQMIMN